MGDEPLPEADVISDDERLAASLTLLAVQITGVAEEILAGLFDRDERLELAAVMSTIAERLRRVN